MWNFILNHSPIFYLTQSLWRDEAYSVLVARLPISQFIGKLTFEPPFYYVLLHFWVKLFGTSEIAVRSLSFVALGLAAIVVIEWADKLFHKHWLAWATPLFFILNPMLLYYGFEVRTYGWYTLFAVLSLYAYWEKKWLMYVLAVVLGFYNHSYIMIVPATQVLHYLWIHRAAFAKPSLTKFSRDPMVRSLLAIGILTAPWILKVIRAASQLGTSWYFPVDMQLVKSALGNLFLGYEGTPGGLWNRTALLSLAILAAAGTALYHKAYRKIAVYFTMVMLLPLIAVIGVSFIKPLYVNRYVLPVTIAEIFLIALAVGSIRAKQLQMVIALMLGVGILYFNAWYPTKHAKFDSRTIITEINTMMSKRDFVYVDTPLLLFETMYYSRYPANVYLYNPDNSPFPWYVGDIVVSPDRFTHTYPVYPQRAFILHKDGTYDVNFLTPFVSRPVKKSSSL